MAVEKVDKDSIDIDLEAIFTFETENSAKSGLTPESIHEKFDYDIKMHRLDSSIVIQAPTWKMRDELSIENFYDEFYRNPSNANRDFGANPIDAVSPAIPHHRFIDLAFEKLSDVKHPILKNPYVQPNGDITKTLFSPKYRNSSRSITRYAHVDIGLTRDRLGLAVGHAIGWKEAEYRNVSGRKRRIKEPIIVFDMLASFKGYQENPVQLITIRQVLFDMLLHAL